MKNWNVDALGTWSDATKWPGGTIPGAAGDTANLTFDITGARTIALDATSRTVGILNIGDADASHVYTLNATGTTGTSTFSTGSINNTGTVTNIGAGTTAVDGSLPRGVADHAPQQRGAAGPGIGRGFGCPSRPD